MPLSSLATPFVSRFLYKRMREDAIANGYDLPSIIAHWYPPPRDLIKCCLYVEQRIRSCHLDFAERNLGGSSSHVERFVDSIVSI